MFRRWGLLAIGLVMLIVGFALTSQPLSFGWCGYADGAFARFSLDLVAMPTGAALALAVGIALTFGWLGFRAGTGSGHDGGERSP